MSHICFILQDELNENDIEEFASSGNCKFWEALEEKFPCYKRMKWSTAYSVIMPVCVTFSRYAHIQSSSTQVNMYLMIMMIILYSQLTSLINLDI